jgi:DNA polymerase III subunit alpha
MEVVLGEHAICFVASPFSTFSFLDGYGTPAQHVARAAELGMGSLALTDHGNVSSHVQLEKAALKAGVKPIFGLEAYTAAGPQETRKFHLTILAMNQTGLANLYRLVTLSWENFYRWPTVDGKMLASCQDGLIVLSGCSDSLLACSLLGGKSIPEEEASWERAYRLAGKMKDLLGDRFYLECQIFPELPRALQINTAYEKLGRDLGIKLVATADVHTLRPGQHEIRALLHAAGRGNNTIAQQLSEWEYDVPDYVPLDDDTVLSRLQKAGLDGTAAIESWAHTEEIAARCNVTLPKAEQFRYPATQSEMKWAVNG